jgi:regulator of chromosome condensation
MGLTTEGNKKTPIEVVKGLVAVDIASGNDHLVILAKNGHVYTIGCAEQGQLGRVTSRTLTGESRRGKTSLLTPGTISKKAGFFIANAIWATPFCTFLRENGSNAIYGFGLNNYNQLGYQKNGKEYEHYPILCSFKDVKTIAGGQHHTIILTNDDKVFAIGRKDYGRLGLGKVESDVEELTLIKSLEKEKIVSITCGDSNSFALTNDGKIYVWGIGTNNQLGTGEEDDVDSPKLLTGAQVKEKKVFSVSSGGQHSLFIVEVPYKEEKTEKPAAVKVEQNVQQKNKKKSTTPVNEPVIEIVGETESTNATDLNGNSEKIAVVEAPKQRGKKRKA